MRRFFKIVGIVIGVVVVIGVVAYAGIMFMSAGKRDIAKNFIIDATSGAYDKAQAVMHQELLADANEKNLGAMLETASPYTEVSFSTIQMSGASTYLAGTAKTENGCVSELEIKMIEEQLLSFNINPLCVKR